MRKIGIMMAIMLFVGGVTVYADYRYYAWTYQFMTMLPGKAEIEFYNTMTQSNVSDSSKVSWKRQTELEIGLTNKWDVSFYMVNSYKTAEAKVTYDEVKFRTRYKLAQKDIFIVDPLAYVEYKYQVDRSFPDKWEFKLVLAKDLGKINLAVNIIPEEYYTLGTKDKAWKTEYSSGISYQIIDEFLRIGIEAKGDFGNDKHSLGPVVSMRRGVAWAVVSPIFALNDKTDDLNIHMILGILF